LTSLDLSQCDSLKTLHCNTNNLSTLLVNSSVLEKLYCRDNKLESLDLRKCENLETFEHRGNEETLKELLLGKCKIKELKNVGGLLTSLDVSQCDSLESLYVGSNNLSMLKLGTNKKLKFLDCNYNPLLTSLDLSQCESIQYLDCSYCALTSLDLSQCKNLKTLNCTQNQLTALDVRGCKNLESLECASWNLVGEITSLNVSDCSMLTSLNCRGNKLTSLDLSGCTALTSLNCSWNNILLLDFKDNLNLTTVDCSFNRISEFKNYDDVPLKSLDASYNSFGFSQVTPKLYELLKESADSISSGFGFEYCNVGWRPQNDICDGDTLDLSKETTAYDGSPVTIIVKIGSPNGQTEIEGNNGKYVMKYSGNYANYVAMTCETMPAFRIGGAFSIKEASAITQLPMDGMEISINGGVVNVNGLADGVKAALYDTAGRMVGSAQGGSTLSINAPGSGIYILRLSDTQGRTSAVKLMVK